MEKRKSLGCESQNERFCPVVSTSCGLMSLDLQEVAQRGSFFNQVVQGETPYEKQDTQLPLPGVELAAGKMPGHWLLARLGKRVLRPGGLELTRVSMFARKYSARMLLVETGPACSRRRLAGIAAVWLESSPRCRSTPARHRNAPRFRQIPTTPLGDHARWHQTARVRAKKRSSERGTSPQQRGAISRRADWK